MGSNRLEAFSDGVIAIIITIMVLELKVPHETTLAALSELVPTLFSYILSFVFIGIYWNNHHHMLHTCKRVTAGILWANLFLLFWLSLIPFATGWMGENHFAPVPTALYGVALLLSGAAYRLLQQSIIASQGTESLLRHAVGGDWKGLASLVLYGIAIPTSLAMPFAATALYVVVALMWLIPDRRIERVLQGTQ
jgi:uncharacterized membrane protein